MCSLVGQRLKGVSTSQIKMSVVSTFNCAITTKKIKSKWHSVEWNQVRVLCKTDKLICFEYLVNSKETSFDDYVVGIETYFVQFCRQNNIDVCGLQVFGSTIDADGHFETYPSFLLELWKNLMETDSNAKLLSIAFDDIFSDLCIELTLVRNC